MSLYEQSSQKRSGPSAAINAPKTYSDSLTHFLKEAVCTLTCFIFNPQEWFATFVCVTGSPDINHAFVQLQGFSSPPFWEKRDPKGNHKSGPSLFSGLFQREIYEMGSRPHNSTTKLKRGKPFFRQMWPVLHNDKTILNHCLRNSPLLNFVSRVNNLSAAKAEWVNKIIWAKSDEKTMH